MCAQVGYVGSNLSNSFSFEIFEGSQGPGFGIGMMIAFLPSEALPLMGGKQSSLLSSQISRPDFIKNIEKNQEVDSGRCLKS